MSVHFDQVNGYLTVHLSICFALVSNEFWVWWFIAIVQIFCCLTQSNLLKHVLVLINKFLLNIFLFLYFFLVMRVLCSYLDRA